MAIKPIECIMGLLVAATWGMGMVFAKAGIEHFPPMLLMTLRSILTTLVLLWFVKIPRGSLMWLFFVAAVSGTLQFGLTLTGLKHVDASIAALIVQLEVPILVLLGVIFLHEKPDQRKWIGIALAVVGVLVISGQPRISNSWDAVLLLVGGSIAWAVGQIMVRSLQNIDGLTVCAWTAVLSIPQLVFCSLLFETGQYTAIVSAGWEAWSAVIYLGLVMTAGGYGLWYTLVRRHPVNNVAPFLLTLPIFSIIGGVLLLGEQLTLSMIIGGAIIIGGVALIVLERKQKTEEQTRLEPIKEHI